MITENTILHIATAPKRNSATWDRTKITWGEIIAWMDTPAHVKEAGNYLLGQLTEKRRRKSTIHSRCAITLDADSPSSDFVDRVLTTLDGVALIIHTTYSSMAIDPRYRVIIPLGADISPQEYYMVAEYLMDAIGVSSFDPGSSQAERYMFKPAHPESEPFWFQVQQGAALDYKTILAEWDGSLDELPSPNVAKGKRDPLAVPGVVGLFNQVYQDFDQLVEEFELPYEKVAADRYRLVGASGAAGMGPVQGYENLFYSHHSHDPAYGQACSAFDVVRLHKFGHLDKAALDSTPINRLPSTKAMMDSAIQIPAVRSKTAAGNPEDDFGVVASSDGDKDASGQPSDNWRDKLRLNSKTGAAEDTIGNWDLIVRHDPVFKNIYYNAMALQHELADDTPWREVFDHTRGFGDRDQSELMGHVERRYGFRPADTRINQALDIVSHIREKNPVLDYLSALKWDGEERLEYALPGVLDSAYTRLVARKTFVAAVARMFEPGCKWDHMTIFYGKEGLGKSRWIEKISRGWYTPLKNLDSTDTIEAMQKSWITVSDEGHSMKKADFDQLKEFITQTNDTFRLKYAKRTLTTPRHNVIWGTTNDHQFLRRQEGNRRFLVVKAELEYDFDAMTDEYIDQVWAEAVHYYRAGEDLFLDDRLAELAANAREEFTQEDAITGLIQNYLDTPVPTAWDSMSLDQRAEWRMDRASGFNTDHVEGRIDRVCSLQVWVEVLEKRIGDHRRIDLLEISNALRDLPGWVQLPGREYLPGYGKQVVFQRVGGAKAQVELDFEKLI